MRIEELPDARLNKANRLAHEVARAASWYRAWHNVFGACFLMNKKPKYRRADAKKQQAGERLNRALDAYERLCREERNG